MDFVAAARNGTHVYHVGSLKEEPALVQSLPPAHPGNAHCLASSAAGYLAVLLHQTGSVGIWDIPWLLADRREKVSTPLGISHCEIPSQSGPTAPILRCYFSPRSSFLVTWEQLGGLKLEPSDGKGNGKPAFARAENLRVWSLRRRPGASREFDFKITKDGSQRLGINVDHLDGRSLLVRRVDPGLVESYNSNAASDLVLAPGDQIIRVNKVSSNAGAAALSEEIQRAKVLQLFVRKGAGFLAPSTSAGYFAPHISPLSWPPVQWTCDERFAFRFVKDDIQVLEGHSLAPVRRISAQHISQLNVSPNFQPEDAPTSCFLAAFCPAASSCVPAMVRIFADCGKGAKPVLTKSLFSDAAWVTMRWDPVEGSDLLLLVHSSELTEDDMAFRTLCGHGGNILYLLRPRSKEPVTSLATSEEICLDVQWCPSSGDRKRMILLQGPQPAKVSIISYSGSGATQREEVGRFGDPFGRSFCVHVQSERGMGLSNEADSADLFNMTQDLDLLDGAVAHRAAVAVTRGERDQYLGPTISRIDFSPDGRTLMANEFGSELRFLNVLDGKLLCRIKFDGGSTALWRPMLGLAPPDFPVPEHTRSTLAPTVELRDKDRRDEIQAESTGPPQYQSEEEQDLHFAIGRLEEASHAPPSTLILEFNGVEGSSVITCHPSDVQNGGSRELALRFCRQQHLETPWVSEPSLANALAERLERLVPRFTGGYSAPSPEPATKASMKPKKAPINTEDPEAVRRRVRALQKKMLPRKLKQMPSASLDVLQTQKIDTEPEIQEELTKLEDQLDLLERPPKLWLNPCAMPKPAIGKRLPRGNSKTAWEDEMHLATKLFIW
eukprot:s1256_g1.t1